MKTERIWECLGIHVTDDRQAIIDAYRAKVVQVNPEDDPEGFQELREAYESALKLVDSKNDVAEESTGDPVLDKCTEEFRDLIAEAIELYDDVFRRINLDEWKKLFEDSRCCDLDYIDTAREEFLKFALDRFYLPYEVWKLWDETFQIISDMEDLRERFPGDFLDYVEFHIQSDELMDYDHLISREEYDDIISEEGAVYPELPKVEDRYRTDYEEPDYYSQADNYLRQINNITVLVDRIAKSEESEEKTKLIATLYETLRCLRSAELWHPFELAGYIRLYMFLDMPEKAAEIAGQLVYHDLFKLDNYAVSTAAFAILKNYEWLEKVGTVPEDRDEKIELVGRKVDEVLENNPRFILGLICSTYVYYFKRDYKKANQVVLTVFEVDSANSMAINLMKMINDKIIESYETKYNEGTATEEEIIELCWSCFRCEQVDRAIEILSGFTPEDPDDYEYHNIFGRALNRNERYEEALGHLVTWRKGLLDIGRRMTEAPDTITDKESKRYKRLGYSYFLVGETEFHLGMYEEAEKDMLESIEKEINDNDIPYYQENLGILYHKQKRYDKEMEIWNKMIEDNKYCVPAYVHRQEAAYDSRDGQLVIDDFYNITQYVPNYDRAYEFAAKVYEAYDQYEDMEKVFERAENNGAFTERLELVRVTSFVHREMYDDAEPIVEKLIESARETLKENPEAIEDEYFEDVYYNYATILEQKGKDPVPALTEAIRLFGEDNSYFRYLLGNYYFRNDNNDKAEPLFNEVYKLNPNHWCVNNKLSRIWSDRYNETEKIEYFNKAAEYADRQLEINDDPFYLVESALIYLDNYQFERALSDSRKAIESDPDNVYAYNAAGYSCMFMKDYENAEKYFKTGIQKLGDTRLPNLFRNLSKCYNMQNKFKEAEQILKEGIELYGTAPMIYDSLLGIYKRDKKYDEALEMSFKLYDYYEQKLKKTGNNWYRDDLMCNLLTRADIYFISKNTVKFNETLAQIENMIDEKGIMGLFFKQLPEEEAEMAAGLLKHLGKFYLYTMRDYSKAIKALERAANYSAKVEDLKSLADYDGYIEIYQHLAQCYGKKGKLKQAREYAVKTLEAIKRRSGSIENFYTDYPSDGPRRRTEVAVLFFLAGRTDDAYRLIDSGKDCLRCNYCHESECYELILGLNRIAEIKGDLDQARRTIIEAYKISPDDAEVVATYRALVGGKN